MPKKNPWISSKRVAVFVFLLTVLAGIPGMMRLQPETDATDSFVPQHGEEADIYRRYLDRFPADYGTVVVATGNVWTPERWNALLEIEGELEDLDAVDRVVGLTSADYVTGTGEIVEVEDFADLEAQSGPALRDLALAYAPYQRRLLNEDGSALALYVACVRGVDAITFDKQVTPVIAKYRSVFLDDAGGDLFQSGDQYMSAEIARQTQASTVILGLSILLMFVVASVVTRSIMAGMFSTATGIFAAYFTFALMGYTGITLNSVNSLTINMLIPLGAAFTIHAVEYIRRDDEHLFGIIPVSGIWPFVFATGSTMIGFGTSAISSTDNVVQFGLLGVFGIFACWFTTVFLTCPMMVRFSTKRPRRADEDVPPLIESPLRMPTAALYAITGLLLALGIGGSFLAEVNYEPIDYVLPDNPARIDADRGTALFSRHNMPLVFPGAEDGEALDPAKWKKIEALASGLRRDYPEVKTAWLYDQIEQLSLAFTADDAKPTALPDSANLIAQYLLLFDEHDIEPYIDADRRDLVLVLQIPFRNSTVYRAFYDDLRSRLADAGLEGHLTGRQKILFDVGDLMATENLQSLAIGLLILYIVFTVVMRSPLVGFVALLVNAIPVIGCVGFMGFFDIDLDLDSSIVAAVALGIVVDDTGHMMARYDRHRRGGATPDIAARAMLREMWRPVTATTVVIAIGFSVLNFATLVPFHTFARTLTFTMIVALITDLFLLPALLVHLDRRTFSTTTAAS